MQRWTQLWSLPNKEGQRAEGRTTEGPRVHLLPPSQHIQNLNQVAPSPESVGTCLVTAGKWNSIPAEQQPAQDTLGHCLKISRDQVWNSDSIHRQGNRSLKHKNEHKIRNHQTLGKASFPGRRPPNSTGKEVLLRATEGTGHQESTTDTITLPSDGRDTALRKLNQPSEKLKPVITEIKKTNTKGELQKSSCLWEQTAIGAVKGGLRFTYASECTL